MSGHSLPMPLSGVIRWGIPLTSDSVARWARGDVRSCIVFVHGWGGLAVQTWGDFPTLASEGPEFDGTDLIFLGYDSRASSASYNSGVIYSFVKQLATAPSDMIAEARGPQRDPSLRYDRIVLVGHSLGGALVRDAAMSAKREGEPWAEQISLGLFAPAHLGANLMDLIKTGTGFLRWAGLIEAVAIAASPALRDLKPDSAYIRGLIKLAEEIGVHCTTKAHFVAHASRDSVVSQDRFFRDPPVIPYPNQNHVSCCKPIKPNFVRPIFDVAGALT